jgi:hypothetical protein
MIAVILIEAIINLPVFPGYLQATASNIPHSILSDPYQFIIHDYIRSHVMLQIPDAFSKVMF